MEGGGWRELVGSRRVKEKVGEIVGSGRMEGEEDGWGEEGGGGWGRVGLGREGREGVLGEGRQGGEV